MDSIVLGALGAILLLFALGFSPRRRHKASADAPFLGILATGAGIAFAVEGIVALIFHGLVPPAVALLIGVATGLLSGWLVSPHLGYIVKYEPHEATE